MDAPHVQWCTHGLFKEFSPLRVGVVSRRTGAILVPPPPSPASTAMCTIVATKANLHARNTFFCLPSPVILHSLISNEWIAMVGAVVPHLCPQVLNAGRMRSRVFDLFRDNMNQLMVSRRFRIDELEWLNGPSPATSCVHDSMQIDGSLEVCGIFIDLDLSMNSL